MSQSRESSINYRQKVKLRKSDQLDLICEKCGTGIDSANININSSLAKCENCNSVFTINEDHFFSNQRKGRPEMIMPEGTDVLELNDSLDIRLNWLKSHPQSTLTFLTLFAVFWNGILFVIAGVSWIAGDFNSIAFMSVHLLIGLGIIYYLASVYLNYTDVIVSQSYIEIDHRPIKNPFKKKIRIESEFVDQLYVTKYVSSSTNGVPNYAYALYAILKLTGKKIKLIQGMNKETQLYIEQEIERYLRISDRPVSDSIKS